MSRRALIDTNIMLDIAMAERPQHDMAVLLVDEILYKRLDACIAATSLKDVYYVLTKYAGEENARDFVRATMDAMQLAAVDESVCRSSADSDEPDFEDGIVRACAERAGVDLIISRDESAFAHSTIRRLSAREYIDLFANVTEMTL